MDLNHLEFPVAVKRPSNETVNEDNDSFKSTTSTLDNRQEVEMPPVPPPRTRRGLATKAAKAKLQDLHIAAESLEIVANELLNIGETDYMPPVAPGDKNVIKDRENELKGNLHMLVVSAKGLRQVMKTRWFVYDKKNGKLKYYRSEAEEKANELPLGQLDLSSATFCYDLETDVNGEFSIV